ncbi:WXG100 family type VII secretion target [Mycolicibacterium sphagni]|jgi:WXG100 family type VII secretion target|uniref:WXG100 family type VII secretion target n=1 Tax=Mycolicibacterium sphagni TaxID=1786 RepID=A0ABX2JWQ3_9MYCO|nr:WXG100 family type VII secretion target [Mycolicibacterium sphagni]NTY62169.1 WXG100 family type VII secretion target [Mycolicibacterium sphagni]
MADSMGGGGQLHADNPQMQVAVAHMDSTSSQIRSLMHSISGYVSDVSGSAWGGEANVAFQNSMTHWNEAAVKMDKVLQDIHDGVFQSRVAHDSQEDANVSDLTRAGHATFGISPM